MNKVQLYKLEELIEQACKLKEGIDDLRNYLIEKDEALPEQLRNSQIVLITAILKYSGRDANKTFTLLKIIKDELL